MSVECNQSTTADTINDTIHDVMWRWWVMVDCHMVCIGRAESRPVDDTLIKVVVLQRSVLMCE